MSMAIDGLITGMSTTEMVSQLMQIEAMPQTALKNKITGHNKAITAYQAVNTKMAALTTAAKALGEATTWEAVKATSSSDAAIVTATPGTITGSLSFTVDKLAAAQTLTYTDPAEWLNATTEAVTTAATMAVPLTAGGTVSVATGDKSLGAVVDAINNADGAAYKAAAVQIAPGKYTLQLTATTTGVASAFAVPPEIDEIGAGLVTTLGADAQLTLGDPGSQFTITSATNTFAEVLPGLNVTVTRTQTASPVTISVSDNPDAVASKVEALVNAANAALAEIRTQTATKSGATAAGPLVGDTAVRNLRQEILSAVAAGAGANGSLATVGIELDRAGTLTFDKTTFLAAHADDPADARTFFTGFQDKAGGLIEVFDPGWDTADGLAHKLAAIGLGATEGITRPTDTPTTLVEGTLAGIIKRRNESITGLNDQVAAWDVRLATRKTNLQRQFSSLEVAMGKMQQQSNWLAGQLAGLA